MEANYPPALKAVLIHEGGYSNHPSDPGGPTNKGIIQRVYDDWRRQQGLPTRSVREITDTEVTDIYHARYWVLAKCFRLPAGLDYVVFDGAVNSGVTQVGKWLQRALGDCGQPVTVDGLIGDSTIAACNRVDDVDALITALLDRRLAMLKALRTWSVFGRGWATRVADARKLGQAVAEGSVDLPMPAGWAGGKAFVTDAKKPPAKAVADAVTGGGIVQTTLSTVTDTLLPVADRSTAVATLVTALMVGGALLAAGGIAYGAWARWRTKKLADVLDLSPPQLGTEAAPLPAAA